MTGVLMRCLRVLPALFLVVSVTAVSWADEAEKKPVFKAGAATSNITPPLGELIVGSFAPMPATYVHDELHARCLLLNDGKTTVGFVICDSLKIDKVVFDEARKYISEETNLPADNILMAATHTHSATQCLSPKYQHFLARRIADAVRIAERNMVPAKIGWGGIDEPTEVFIRRWHVTDPALRHNPFGGIDEARMNPPAANAALVRPTAVPDPEISFISVQTLEGKPISLLANYSLHYVGGVPAGHISADYFAVFAKKIGELLEVEESHPPFVGILSNGTSGDANNHNYAERVERSPAYVRMDVVAGKVAKRVLEAHQQIKFHDWVSLDSVTRGLDLKVRKPDAEMQAYAKKILDMPENAKPLHHRYERSYANRVLNLLNSPDEITIPLQVIRIGDLVISGIPFEVFSAIGLELKEKTPFADAFTIELANDSQAYLPTPDQHKLGGYETWMGTNRVQLDASVLINKQLLEMMQELKEKVGK